jgi:hypothetical protein
MIFSYFKKNIRPFVSYKDDYAFLSAYLPDTVVITIDKKFIPPCLVLSSKGEEIKDGQKLITLPLSGWGKWREGGGSTSLRGAQRLNNPLK